MLHFQNLSVSYGDNRILNNITFSLNKGESMALIGESGTGKTTLARSILGLCSGNCVGEIKFKNQNLLTLPPQEMGKIRWNQIAMVFQNVEDALNPLHTALEQVIEPMVEHRLMERKKAIERASRLLERVGLAERFFSSYPHQLSGGQKQRVLIAMALSNDPELLILDEPTSALDPITKADIIELLREVSHDCALLIVTHDLSVASQLAEKTAVLYGGRILELGPTELLLEEPRHPYTRGLLRAFPNLTTTKDLQGIPGQLSRPPLGCPFAPRCTQKDNQCLEEYPELENIGDRFLACHLGGIVPLLTVKNLCKSFGKNQILDEVNLTLFEGETVAIIGESGSGKTTLARTLMGLYDYSKGSIGFRGLNQTKKEKHFYRYVQMIYQNPSESISHRHTVVEAVKEPLNIHRIGNGEEGIQIVKRVLREVQLPDTEEFLQTYPHHLSGGEAQRLAIARALVLEPKLLIADEPTSALDPSVQAKIIKLLMNLQETRGLSLLLITHDIALAKKTSDRLIVLRNGRIIEEGPTHKILATPSHPYTKKLIETAPGLRRSKKAMDSSV